MVLRGSPDTKSRLRWTRRRFRMSLARWRLCHGHRSGDADPAIEAVDGSDPPPRHASIGIGQDGDVHPHPPLRCAVAPSQQSVPEGCQAPLRGAGGPVARPPGRRLSGRAHGRGDSVHMPPDVDSARAVRHRRRPIRRSRSQAHGGMLRAHADRAGPAFGLGLPGTDTGGLPLGGARNVVRGSGGIPRPEVNVQR